MSLKKLSIDELGTISHYTKKEDLHNLRPSFDRNKKDFKEVDERRCRDREFQFKNISGVSLEDFIDKLKENHKFIDDTIDEAMEYHQNIKLSDSSRKYFHDLFGFSFNINDIVKIYIYKIIKGTSPVWDDEDVPEDIDYKIKVRTKGFLIPTSYNDATMDFQIFEE